MLLYVRGTENVKPRAALGLELALEKQETNGPKELGEMHVDSVESGTFISLVSFGCVHSRALGPTAGLSPLIGTWDRREKKSLWCSLQGRRTRASDGGSGKLKV
jgi:hypothetical protein